MSIPKEGFFDVEPEKSDSIIHYEERAAKIRAESEELERQQTEVEKQRAADQLERVHAAQEDELKRVSEIVRAGDTRDALLERIRRMREEAKPKEVVYPPLTEGQQKQLDAEQAAGRAAVAKAEAEEEYYREIWRKQEEEEKKRQGTMTSVFHANPSQEETYPTSGATLGKKK